MAVGFGCNGCGLWLCVFGMPGSGGQQVAALLVLVTGLLGCYP